MRATKEPTSLAFSERENECHRTPRLLEILTVISSVPLYKNFIIWTNTCITCTGNILKNT